MAALSLSCCTKDLRSLLQYVKSFNCNIWDPVLWPGIEPGPPALKSWSLSRWTTKEVPPPPCCSFCGQASSQLPAVIHAYALLGENLLQPLCHLLDFAKMSLCAGVSPPRRLKQGLFRPLDPWDMHDVIARFPSFVQGLFLASWPLCTSKSQAHTDTQ